MMRSCFCTFVSFATLSLTAIAAPRADHVFIVSIDGGKPAVIAESEAPTLKQIAAEGAVTWQASTIFPSITLPSHTSMLTGVGPDKHQILWNNFTPIKGFVKVPTVFSLLKAADPMAVDGMFVGKVKFRHLWLKDSVDVFDFGGPQDSAPVAGTPEIEKDKKPSQMVAKQASAWIKEHKPKLAFIHFPDVDSAGHKSGWGSPEQKEAIKVTDQALWQVWQAIKDAGIADSSVMLISADHGGHDKTHGLNIPDDMIIPWVAWGKGVKKNFTITDKVTTYDTAATALWLLDVPVPAEFDGKPVTSAFE
ncbi:MAG: alkaline phosphatase family protein [Prosthecobacter sp.]|jgi:predicted AlkP superfamily pyrophosphatase or phosphodiesterase|uniref:alkaline phosphatase family protein n=1 Tax=Prosthecobacter sp. TaxID=1965333 RepID=UPI001A0D5E32|nr:alkaline phosphatase family protein [Prosthecobacter sp.]MBE2284152.1 alkaline phosphatase family protein [Prosthecobacter sp.]